LRIDVTDNGCPVAIRSIASYLPATWMTAAEISWRSGIPEEVVVGRMGLRGKHIAAADEHVSDMSARAGAAALAAAGADPAEVDLLVYFGSSYKDYPVWQAAPRIAALLGVTSFALELDYVSCGGPVALRVCRDMMRSEPELRTVLVVGAARESALIDYTNQRSRFMFDFGDGAVAAVLRADPDGHLVLGSDAITDGSLSLAVKVPAGGSVQPASDRTVADSRHLLDVTDPAEMKRRLDGVSLDNFVRVAAQAMKRSGAGLGDIAYVCPLHVKRSMHEALLSALDVRPEHAEYLDDTGHMSGVDTLLGLERAGRAGRLSRGDLVLLLAAGTGYTWAATVVRWGGGRV
jgi:3-oxoacyl-[acyl-carrier-protein] synthase-3